MKKLTQWLIHDLIKNNNLNNIPVYFYSKLATRLNNLNFFEKNTNKSIDLLTINYYFTSFLFEFNNNT